MSDALARIADFVATIVQLALVSFGGIVTVLPAIHHHVVDDTHWLSNDDFASYFAIAQASPGPNVLVLTLIGLRIGGFLGAAAATAALTVPTALLAYGVAKVWERFRDARWRRATQVGVLPVAAGFIAASTYVIAQVADHTVAAYAITFATLAVAVATKINPLWMFAAGALLGVAGLLS